MNGALWSCTLALRNLRRHYRRNAFTALALCASSAGIILFCGYVLWVEKYLRANTVYLNQIGHLTLAIESQRPIPVNRLKGALLSKELQDFVAEKVRHDPQLEGLSLGLDASALLLQGCRSLPVLLIGRDEVQRQRTEDHPFVNKWNQELLRPQLNLAYQRHQAEDLHAMALSLSPFLQQKLAKDDGVSCALSTSQAYQLMGRTFAGFPAAMDGQFLGEESSGLAMLDEISVFVSTRQLQDFLETQGVSRISLYVKDLWRLPLVYFQWSKALAAYPEVRVIPFFFEDFGLYYTGSVAFLMAVAFFFLGLVTVLVSLSLASLMILSLSERSAEIGLFKAIGFEEKDLSRLYLLETFLLSFLSLSIGIGLAYGLSILIESLNIRFSPPGIAGSTRFMLSLDPWMCAGIFLLFLGFSQFGLRWVLRAKLKKSAIELLSAAESSLT